MKTAYLTINFLSLFLLLVQPICMISAFAALPPQIQPILPLQTNVEQYDKFEITVDLNATFTNPYDYSDIHLSAIFTAPDEQLFQVDGFYMESFILNENNGTLYSSGENGQFKIRFAPMTVGTWSYRIKVSNQDGTTYSEPLHFNCSPSDNQGFISHNNSNYLSFSNGDQYIPIGENMAWQSHNVYHDYHKWLTALSENQGNFIRLWHAHWGLGIEWKNGWQQFEGLKQYHQKNAAYQDWLFDFCTEKKVKVMLTLQHHGQVSTNVNPEWSSNPYNAANGGMCQDVWDFFSNKEAINYTKNRLRYIVARWGYAQSIMAWELFNEVDWMNDYAEKDWMVMEWHQEMATFLKEIDPYQHLVTTSFAEATIGANMWDIPTIDLTQTHFYLDNPHLERALANGIQRALDDFQKPTLTGEFGLGIHSNMNLLDPDGIHIHNALWGALFAGGVGTGMSWWWDSYIDAQNLYYHYAPIAKVSQDISFVQQKMTPTEVNIIGALGNLSIVPTAGWGADSDDFINIYADGSTSPENIDLNIYLYGNRWNTQHKNPPTFRVYYPNNATFSVTTATQSGSRPKIAIYLDGQLALETNALPNQTYSIQIPAGQHDIKIDNTGRDWITIAGYQFENLGTQIDAYVLRSNDKKTATGWVLNNQYNYQFIDTQGRPEVAIGGQLLCDNWLNGTYQIDWYDCLTGSIILSERISIEASELVLNIPDLYWDLAFKIYPTPNPVSTNHFNKIDDFTLFPNPIKSGEALQIKHAATSSIQAVYLLDATGKMLYQFDQHLQISSKTPAGFYWVKIVNQENQSLTKPLVVR